MWARRGQRENYDCSDGFAENHFLNVDSELFIPTIYDYHNLNQGHGNPCAFYTYPDLNNYNWTAYYAHIASLWRHYFYGNNAYIQDPYVSGHWAYPDERYSYPSNQEYVTVPEAWNDVSQSVPIYTAPPSRNSTTPRASPDSTPRKEQWLPHNSQDEAAFSATATSSSPETVPTTTNSSENSPTTSASSDDAFVGTMATTYGTISVYLRQKIRVDLTIDKAIRLINYSNGTVVSMSSDGCNICLIHENGKALLENETVHSRFQNIMAKITKRGVIFTALKNSLIYLVDASGTKSTTERFRDLGIDFSVGLFYSGSTHGPEVVEDCVSNLNRHFYRSYPEGDEAWTIAGVRIKQSNDGEVRISRDFGLLTLRMSPASGSVSVSTDNAHMSASSNDDKLFFVRQGENRLVSRSDGFTARHGTQKAGFDQAGQIIL